MGSWPIVEMEGLWFWHGCKHYADYFHTFQTAAEASGGFLCSTSGWADSLRPLQCLENSTPPHIHTRGWRCYFHHHTGGLSPLASSSAWLQAD